MEITNARKWGTFAVCALVAIVPNIDLTALNQAVPKLSADLRPSATQILWIADAYGFVLAGLLITMGVIGDRIGHKRLLMIGVSVFAVASAATAYAPSAEWLIAARAVLGAAGATLMPSGLSLVRRVFTEPKERTMAVGLFMGVGGLAVGLGPVIGGALLDDFWWGSVFLINVPVMLVALVAGLLVLPESRNPNPGRLDVVSVPLSVAGVLGVVYAIKEAAAHGVAHARIGIAAGVGLVALVWFVRRQLKVGHPLIDMRLFRRAAFAGSVVTNLFAMFALVAQSLIFSIFFQMVYGWSPLRSGLAGLPGAVAAMVGGAALAPPLINAIGRARTVAAGLALSTAAFAAFTLVDAGTAYWVLVLPMAMSGVGMGMALTVTGDTVLASVPKDRSGAASAISETATELGGALGMAILGSVLTAVYRDRISVPQGVAGPAGHAVRDSLPAALQVASQLPARLGAQVTDLARNAYVDGMHAALLCSAGFAALVAGAALVTLRSVPKVIEEEGADEPELETAR
ncbi:MFS transporter [Actinomadura rupiterrae]|uniref:MFS transporter n=1 Tax=Actinomadura rupiterrae TaxID=559627 RepID=UPI0020A4DA68|nr:MFS transporter [Actinomadura rupiterrae]MCP2339546.1 DHA2 family multidrug resistance protein-like MFS transporter [Actinomadura rupiterrae]